MKDKISQDTTTATSDNIGLVEVLIIFAKRKKIILGSAIVSAALATALSFVLPNVYKASAILLPPQQQQSGAAALLSQIGGVAGAAAGMAGIKNPNDLYVGMLKSRTIADKLIAKFNLRQVYETDSLEKTRKSLEQNTTIVSGKDGLITIEVEDENQKLVASLANAYVDELIQLTKTLAVTEAAKRRLFFERQLDLAKNNLASAEIALKGAMDAHGVISVDTESRAIVETIGRLRANVSAKEIQLNSMNAFVTRDNPEYKRVEEELNSLRGELLRLENGRDDQPVQQNGKQHGLQNIKILRDVKYYQMLYELLAKQYEVARLDEAKDSSIVQVLDPALAPERKFKPKRAIIAVLSAAVGLIIGLLVALIQEAEERKTRDNLSSAKWAELKNHLSF